MITKYNVYVVDLIIATGTTTIPNLKHRDYICAYSAEDAYYQTSRFTRHKLLGQGYLCESITIVDIYPRGSKIDEMPQ